MSNKIYIVYYQEPYEAPWFEEYFLDEGLAKMYLEFVQRGQHKHGKQAHWWDMRVVEPHINLVELFHGD